MIRYDPERHELVCIGPYLRGAQRVDPFITQALQIETQRPEQLQALVGQQFLMDPMPKAAQGALLPMRFEAAAPEPFVHRVAQ